MKDHWIINRCPLSGSSFTNLLRLLIHNRFRIHIRYIPRLLYSLLLLLITWPLRLLEWIFTSTKVNKHRLQQDPVFIIGHWRSGTTLMHYLFNCDNSKGFVSNVEVYAPHFCLLFPRLARFLVGMSLPPTRPMDKVRINADLPGEEEHSLGALDKYGYFHSMIFPAHYKTYASYETFEDVRPEDISRWTKRYKRFIQKVSLKNNSKALVLKNPANTWRIKYLIKMYPGAKFIHLIRDPYATIASSIRFYDETTRIFTLQAWDQTQTQDKMLDTYSKLYNDWTQITKEVPQGQLVNVYYEDFIKNPLATMESLYKKLDLNNWKETSPRIKTYLDRDRSYKVHKYKYSEEFIEKVNRGCAEAFKLWKYKKR